MRKSLFSLSAAAIMMGGLVGCAANNDNNLGTQNADNARMLGYYSDENQNNDRGARGGNAYRLDDNDGPLTEILDRNTNRNRNEDTNLRINDGNRANNRYKTNNRYGTNRESTDRQETNNNNNNDRGFGMLGNDRNGRYFGTLDNNQNRNNNTKNNGNKVGTNRGNTNQNAGILGNNKGNNGTNGNNNNGDNNNGLFGLFGNNNNNNNNNPYANRGSNTLTNNGYGNQDRNYHGHINNNDQERPRASAYENYGGNLVQQIVERVEKVDNVDDARAVVMGDNILIAVDTKDNNDKNVEKDVRKQVKELTKGKDVRILTDEATYTRVRDIDNNIRNGRPDDTLDADIRNLFDNVGDAIRRPFQTNNNR